MDDGRYRVKLDLMVRVMDATTGDAIGEKNIRFIKDKAPVKAESRGEGCYIFLNSGRENCLMRIEVYGYEPTELDIDYEKLEAGLPEIDVFLIPSEKQRAGQRVITLRGHLPGLEKLEALHPGRPVTGIRDFDAKKRTMTVLSPNRRMNLTRQYYGLLHADKDTFEDIDIKEEIDSKVVRLREPIREEFSTNAPICALVFGQVNSDGSYMLAVRDDGRDLGYLVKYIVKGETRYKKIDFRDLSGVTLD